VLDIKETVDGHTETLAEHGRKLDVITDRLDALETVWEKASPRSFAVSAAPLPTSAPRSGQSHSVGTPDGRSDPAPRPGTTFSGIGPVN
jgi:hypothetical protein